MFFDFYLRFWQENAPPNATPVIPKFALEGA
jgi:hypothetical protein